MVDKWADFLISAVEYTEAPRHINRVEIRLDRGDKVGPPVKVSRPGVLAWIDGGYSVATIALTKTTNTWGKGAEVKVVTRQGKRYIRTDADNKTEDNLGNLPEF